MIKNGSTKHREPQSSETVHNFAARVFQDEVQDLLNTSNLRSTPTLFGRDTQKQGDNLENPGGYLNIIAMSKIPGEPVTEHTDLSDAGVLETKRCEREGPRYAFDEKNSVVQSEPSSLYTRNGIKSYYDNTLGPVAHVARSNKKRWEQSLTKRSDSATTYQIKTEAPYYDAIHNDTCVLTPDVTTGPYLWPRSQTLRQDISEDQPGIPLWLDIGVMDMATCAPLDGVLVDIWHANATGSYSSFTGISADKTFVETVQEKNITRENSHDTDLHTDNATFGRGMWPTNNNGITELKTIFPGFYAGRAVHIHVQVHTDWSIRENGTMADGNTVSTGQLYFDESLVERIMAEEPYSSHKAVQRVTNAEDHIVPKSFQGGFSPIMSVVPVDGEDVTKGMVGYITLGVDTEAVQSKK
ncbi:intradiol ring-cleavage dioxygenase [Aspergillus affinis]|uniref:intradiol ring-cleavage dioxygenase n=1 Tax=Aspergillus affinis TaxID=1070780 RepID=UPI0022FDE90D|nr:Intradiol ring-cleavage dioxygenase [Aspergillus affinis]KAI9041336.1 Intradiol ring-cleavage dioxygenase [Aspergillus affinis]